MKFSQIQKKQNNYEGAQKILKHQTWHGQFAESTTAWLKPG